MATVLVLSNIRVFDAAGLATGPGLRAWGIAAALAARGHRTTLAEPRRGPQAGVDREPRDGVALGWWSPGDAGLQRMVAAADVVIVQPGVEVAMTLGPLQPRCLVVDLYNPVVTEFLALTGPTEPGVQQFGGMLQWYRHFLHRGDYFLCAGERQRQFTLGALAHAGRLNPLTDPDLLLRLVPMGVDPPLDPPLLAGEGPGEGSVLRGPIVPKGAEILLWPGGIYRWFEAVTAVRALARLRSRRPRAVMVFVGAENPLDPSASGPGVAETRAAAGKLGLLNAGVHFAPWQPFENRAAIYQESDLAVITHRPLLEAYLSWRTRSLDCLWGGLPLVVTAGDEVGEIAERAGAGLCVPPEDPEALARTLDDLLSDPARRQTMAAAARRLAAETWSWERVTGPLHQICLDPRPAPDRAAVAHRLGIGPAAQPPAPPRARSLPYRAARRLARSVRAGTSTLRTTLATRRSLPGDAPVES